MHDNIQQLPNAVLMEESERYMARKVKEVMEALYGNLPEDNVRERDFVLKDGTRCWVVASQEPRKDSEDVLCYGFDVKFDATSDVLHMEFMVNCAGWGRCLAD